MTPSDFRSLPYEDRVEMVAYDQTIEDIQAVEFDKEEKRMKREAAARKSRRR